MGGQRQASTASVVQQAGAHGEGRKERARWTLQTWRPFAKFLNLCLLGTLLAFEDTSSTESSLNVLGETFSMASFNTG